VPFCFHPKSCQSYDNDQEVVGFESRQGGGGGDGFPISSRIPILSRAHTLSYHDVSAHQIPYEKELVWSGLLKRRNAAALHVSVSSLPDDEVPHGVTHELPHNMPVSPCHHVSPLQANGDYWSDTQVASPVIDFEPTLHFSPKRGQVFTFRLVTRLPATKENLPPKLNTGGPGKLMQVLLM
jgi:hypothetical protein